MILLTVGTQLPFDRLVKIVDEIATELSEPIFAQIGRGNYIPRNLEYCEMLSPSDMAERFGLASLILSHAGTGSLLTARRYAKRIVLFPRRADKGEHRNDHQLATCRQLEGARDVLIAYDEIQLTDILTRPQITSNATASSDGPGMHQELGIQIARYIKRLSR